MIKQIRYGGLASQPNEYISEDGESALLMNLIPENGGVQPISKGVLGFSLEEGMKIITHKPEDKTNYIAYGNGKVQWVADNFESSFSEAKDILSITNTIVDIATLGNVLVISTSNGMHYAKWDSQKDDYINLGSQIPVIEMDFGLKLDLEGVFDNASIELMDGVSFSSGDADWMVINKTPYITLSEGYKEGNSKVFTSNVLEGISFPKEYEYKIAISIGEVNGLNFGHSANAFKIAEIIRVSDGASFGKGNPIKSIPRTNFDNVCIKIFTHIDVDSISFSMTVYRGLKYYYDEDGNEASYKRIRNTQENFNHITGQINKFVSEKGLLSNKFIYPFFVRYAVRLYDGNYSYISPPVLMIPNSGYAPNISYGDGDNKLLLYAWVATLQHRISIPQEYEAWKELIAGIDIFVSSPIYSYNQGLAFDSTKEQYRYKSGNPNAFGIGIVPNFSEYQNLWGKAYTEQCKDITLELEGYIADVEVCRFAQEEVIDSTSSVDSYYLIKSYTLDELTEMTTDFIDVDMSEGTLQSLQSRKPLHDNVLRYEFSDTKVTTYNNRAIVYKGRSILPHANIPSDCRSYYQVYLTDSQPSLIADKVDVYIHLKTNQGERIVKASKQTSDVDGYMQVLNGVGWFYYADSKAYKATIFFKEKNTSRWLKGEYQLKAHDYLDGAYWVGETIGTDMIEQAQYVNIAEVNYWNDKIINNTLENYGKIYLSEAENPWIFILGNSRTIGDGELIGVASATKALSEGQYGQFPLYAFTSEGVWSLSVTNEGLFNPAQPVTRDICTSEDSITQLDQAVLFATVRGIMMLEGANTACITDKIESELPFDLSDLKGGDALAEMSGIDSMAFDAIPFQEFIEGCSMVYDYVHQRIILYNKKCNYAYVFSLESKAWGMMESNIADQINSYPDAIVVTKDGELLNLSKESKESEDKMKGFMVSRALKLDGADVMKTIDTIIQRGNFDRGDVSTILWGSRDLKNWQLVWSSKDHYLRGFRGSPYNYFRIGALTSLGKDESLIGASINYEPKQNNKLR